MSVLDLVLGFLFDIVGYTTASLLLPVLTFGRIRVEVAISSEPGFNGLGFKRNADSALLCASDFAGWMGVIVWIAVFVSVVALM